MHTVDAHRIMMLKAFEQHKQPRMHKDAKGEHRAHPRPDLGGMSTTKHGTSRAGAYGKAFQVCLYRGIPYWRLNAYTCTFKDSSARLCPQRVNGWV